MKPSPLLVFSFAVAALGLLLVLEWLPAGALPAMKVPAAPTVAQATEDGPARDTDQWSEAVIARPLFTIGRRQPHAAGGTHVAMSSTMPRLSGILISGSSKRAIFMPDTGKPITVVEGGMIEDATVRSIAPDAVTLAGPKGDITLRLSFDKQRSIINPASPGPIFPNGMFNPGLNLNGALPFGNPVKMPVLTPPPAPPPAPDNGDDTGDNPAQDPSVPQPSPPFMPAHPNLPREKE